MGAAHLVYVAPGATDGTSGPLSAAAFRGVRSQEVREVATPNTSTRRGNVLVRDPFNYYRTCVNCPQCGGRSRVPDVRLDTQRNWIKRRRECLDCKNRWNTYEIPESSLTIAPLEEPVPE